MNFPTCISVCSLLGGGLDGKGERGRGVGLEWVRSFQVFSYCAAQLTSVRVCCQQAAGDVSRVVSSLVGRHVSTPSFFLAVAAASAATAAVVSTDALHQSLSVHV